MFRRRDNISTEVKLVDLSKGNNVDPVNVSAGDLRQKQKVIMQMVNKASGHIVR